MAPTLGPPGVVCPRTRRGAFSGTRPVGSPSGQSLVVSVTVEPGGRAWTSRRGGPAPGGSSSSSAPLASDRRAAVSARAASSWAWPRGCGPKTRSAYAARSSAGRIDVLDHDVAAPRCRRRLAGADAPPRSRRRPRSQPGRPRQRLGLDWPTQRVAQRDLDGEVDDPPRDPIADSEEDAAGSAMRHRIAAVTRTGHAVGGQHRPAAPWCRSGRARTRDSYVARSGAPRAGRDPSTRVHVPSTYSTARSWAPHGDGTC